MTMAKVEQVKERFELTIPEIELLIGEVYWCYGYEPSDEGWQEIAERQLVKAVSNLYMYFHNKMKPKAWKWEEIPSDYEGVLVTLVPEPDDQYRAHWVLLVKPSSPEAGETVVAAHYCGRLGEFICPWTAEDVQKIKANGVPSSFARHTVNGDFEGALWVPYRLK